MSQGATAKTTRLAQYAAPDTGSRFVMTSIGLMCRSVTPTAISAARSKQSESRPIPSLARGRPQTENRRHIQRPARTVASSIKGVSMSSASLAPNRGANPQNTYGSENEPDAEDDTEVGQRGLDELHGRNRSASLRVGPARPPGYVALRGHRSRARQVRRILGSGARPRYRTDHRPKVLRIWARWCQLCRSAWSSRTNCAVTGAAKLSEKGAA
jgi:hypothetical protein